MLEERLPEFIALCAREAGKTVNDAISEVREAADFCRYYAARGREQFATAISLHGPTGEHNQLSLHGRGVFVCISPWNFPLAIFMGQVSAALVAGNTVVGQTGGTDTTNCLPRCADIAAGRNSKAGIAVTAR